MQWPKEKGQTDKQYIENYKLSNMNPFICKTRIISFIDGGDGGVARMLPNQQQMKLQSYK